MRKMIITIDRLIRGQIVTIEDYSRKNVEYIERSSLYNQEMGKYKLEMRIKGEKSKGRDRAVKGLMKIISEIAVASND